MRTFKEILSTFEANDYRAFEMLMKNDKDFMAGKKHAEFANSAFTRSSSP
jgi:hypothetical protein